MGRSARFWAYTAKAMPELPEVETIASGVHERTHGRTIEAVWTSNKPQTFKSPPDEIARMLTGKRIERVHRVGKTIVVDLAPVKTRSQQDGDQPAQFLVHLGMTGRLLVSAPETPVPLHTHAILTLGGGLSRGRGGSSGEIKELRFVDARRFGRLSVTAPESRYEGPGSEPLTIAVNDFIALFRGRRTPIKAALLNQSLLHGVGNIYADEALFHAGIRPLRHAGRLTRAELARLRSALTRVLKKAIKLGGSSVSDYVDADGVAGFFQLHHHVYARTGQPCRVCKTPIKRIVVGGRGTHFCPVCQR